MVPEKRQELTTEGGLDAYQKRSLLEKIIPKFRAKKIQVSLFIDPVIKQIDIAKETGASAIEIHTGSYARAVGKQKSAELKRIRKAAEYARRAGLIVHAGHGINYENILPLLKIREIEEYNIGHSIVSRAVFVGLKNAVHEMKTLLR